jgi:hypothetical protein
MALFPSNGVAVFRALMVDALLMFIFDDLSQIPLNHKLLKLALILKLIRAIEIRQFTRAAIVFGVGFGLAM